MSDYQVANDGTIFRIKDDGSISRIGKIENGRMVGTSNGSSSGRGGLVFFSIVCAVAALVFGLLFANARNDYDMLMRRSDQRISDQEQRISSLESDLSVVRNERDAARRELSEFKNKIGQTIPIVISDIEMANVFYDGTIETNYGLSLYSNRTMYLKPQIKYTGFTSGNKTLYIKLYTPGGILSTGSSSPPGYSYSTSTYISNGSNTAELGGWGSRTQGHWASGSYRIEIWYDGSCLKSKSFTVY